MYEGLRAFLAARIWHTYPLGQREEIARAADAYLDWLASLPETGNR